jgi:hypothetical protein
VVPKGVHRLYERHVCWKTRGKIAEVCRDTSGNLVEENRIIEGIVEGSSHQRGEKHVENSGKSKQKVRRGTSKGSPRGSYFRW